MSDVQRRAVVVASLPEPVFAHKLCPEAPASSPAQVISVPPCSAGFSSWLQTSANIFTRRKTQVRLIRSFIHILSYRREKPEQQVHCNVSSFLPRSGIFNLAQQLFMESAVNSINV